MEQFFNCVVVSTVLSGQTSEIDFKNTALIERIPVASRFTILSMRLKYFFNRHSAFWLINVVREKIMNKD